MKETKLNEQTKTQTRRNPIMEGFSSQKKLPADSLLVVKAKMSKNNSTMEILDNFGKRLTSEALDYGISAGD